MGALAELTPAPVQRADVPRRKDADSVVRRSESPAAMTVGPAGDRAEVDADRVASDVVRRLAQSGHQRRATAPPIGETRIRRSSWTADSVPTVQRPESFEVGAAPTKIRRRLDARVASGRDAPVDHASTIPIAQIQRSSQTIRRWSLFGNKDKKADKPKEFEGRAGKTPTTTEEVGKATVGAAGFAGGAKAGAQFAGAGLASGGAAGLGVLLVGDAAMGLNNARKMDNEADEYGDAAMSKAAGRKAKDQTWGMGMGLTMAAKGAAGVGQAIQGAGATSAAAVAGASLGIIGGSAMVLQGTWRGGQAVMKLCRLTWGRGQEILSDEGRKWKAVIVGAEKFKLAINVLKVAAGALGIAAGALFIVSNPVGWALGIAAAIAAAAYAGSKIVGKVSNARDKGKSRDKIDKQVAAEAAKPKVGAPTDFTRADGSAVTARSMGYDPSQMVQAGPGQMADRGSGFGAERAPQGKDDKARKEAISKANAVARDAGGNARISAELRDALSHGSKELVQAALMAKIANPKEQLSEMLTSADDRKLHDAFVLLSAINVDPDQALADSGQDLIEKKLSKAEAM